MRILLTNDDGIHAPGLKVLEEIARQFSDDIWICAPSEEQSGAGHSLTLTRPVRLQQLGERRFAVTGTVSAAIEGALAGVRSIAFSQVYAREGMGDDVPFGAAREWGAKVLAPLIDAPMAERTLINVNFPAGAPEDVKGIRVVRQGFHDYQRGTIVEGRDPRGYRYFWFGLDPIEHTMDHGTDLEAIEDGYIAVTPLQLDLTHYSTIGILAERFGG